MGGSVLAALTVVAGGVVLGSGTAAGEAIIFGSSTGSAGPVPSWLDEALDGLRPCETKYSPPPNQYAIPDRGPCYIDEHTTKATHGNYAVEYMAPNEAEPGAEVTFRARIEALEAAFDVADPEHNVDVTSVTLRAPEGFEFLGATVVGRTPWATSPNPITVDFDSTSVVDPATGDVTVTAPEGGWPIWPGMDAHRFEGGKVDLIFTFRAPERAEGSTHGFTFTGTTVPESRGLVVARNIRVMPDAAGAGSSGS